MNEIENTYLNLLEPENFPALITGYPDPICEYGQDERGVPFFKARFDFLSGLEGGAGAWLKKIPFSLAWSSLFKTTAFFIGGAATEYAPLPRYLAPADLLEDLIRRPADQEPLIIIKDLPQNSPLLSREENSLAQSLADAARQRGFIEIKGRTLAWQPIDFNDQEEYLSRQPQLLKNNLRRALEKSDFLSVETLPLGEAVFSKPKVIDEFQAMHLEAFKPNRPRFKMLGRQALQQLLEGRYGDGQVLIFRQGGGLVCYNICLARRGLLIDKYLGFKYPLPRELSIEALIWFYNLESARKLGLKNYLTGRAGAKIKATLKADFTLTRHLIWIKNQSLRRLFWRPENHQKIRGE